MTAKPYFENETVQNIIGREPGWLITSGLSLIAGLMLVVLMLAYFISVPTTVNAPVEIKTTQPPVVHQAKINGQIGELLVSNNQKVKKGQQLVVLSDAADYQWVTSLKLNLLSLHEDSDKNLQNAVTNNLPVQEFLLAMTTLKQLLAERAELKDNVTLKAQLKAKQNAIDQYQLLLTQMTEKERVVKQQLKLNRKQLDSKQQLKQSGLTTTDQINNAEQRVLANEAQLHDIAMSLSLYQKEIAALQSDKTLLALSNDKALKTKENELSRHSRLLLGQIELWLEKHVITAEVDGVVALHDNLHQLQNVTQQQVLLSISPVDHQYDAWLKVKGNGIGDISLEQKVKIQLAGYAPAQYGNIEGVVSSFSQVPSEEGYLVKVSLPNQLTTTYGIDVANQSLLRGQASIITEPKRLLTRLFERLRYSAS